MKPEQFIQDYKLALATQLWSNVEPLIHENATVVFSNGEVHQGINAIRVAYERNFALIKNEDYQMTNLYWVSINANEAEYTFDFSWRGIINGLSAEGKGKGRASIVLREGRWILMKEVLSKAI